MCGGGLPVGKRLVGDTVVECAPREAGESTRASGADVAEARQHPDRQYHANAGALQHAMDAIAAQNRATDLAHAHTTRSLKERSASSASASSEAEGEIASSKSPPVAITGASQREKGARQKGAYEETAKVKETPADKPLPAVKQRESGLPVTASASSS